MLQAATANNLVNGNAQDMQIELQLLKEENDTLKKVIEQMKLDMEAIVNRVKAQ